MNWKVVPFLLLPAAALAQPTLDGEGVRVLRFAHAESPQQRQEIVNAVRSVAELQRVVADSRAGALAMRGKPEQLEFAAWIVSELDRAPGAPSATAMDSHQAPGDFDPQGRVFFLAHAADPQALQEIVNAVRAVAEVQRVATYPRASAIVLRGASDQVDLAAWLIRNLDKPAGAVADPKPLQFNYNDTSSRPLTAVRIFRIAHSTSPQALQELANALRSITEVQRLMVNNATASIALRGAPAQAAMAEWLIEQLDRPNTDK